MIGDAERRSACAAPAWSTPSPSSSTAGLLDHSGRFIPDEDAAELHPGLATGWSRSARSACSCCTGAATIPATSVFLSQRDVRELQFAKASIATGWKILVRELGVEPGDISQVLLAGQLRRLPDAAQRGAHRAGAEAGAAADRVGRQRRRRGRQDRRAVAARARRGAVDPARGRVRRAVRAAPTSTTCSSTSWRSRDERRRPAVIACGALAVRRAGDRAPARLGRRRASRCPALLHNRPERIAGRGGASSPRDDERRGRRLRRLRHPGRARRAARRAGRRQLLRHLRAATRWPTALAEEPGTYFLTDFLARTFEHTVVRELGLDRWPELRDDYFAPLPARGLARPAPHAGHAALRRGAPPRGSGLPLEVRARGQRRPGARAGAAARAPPA